MHELAKPSIRHRVPFDAVALGPALLREVVCTEEPVHEGGWTVTFTRY